MPLTATIPFSSSFLSNSVVLLFPKPRDVEDRISLIDLFIFLLSRLSDYRPQFYFRTTDVTGIVKELGGAEMVMPGDHVEMTVELIAPIAIEEGTKFSIREGGRTVGSGSVTKIIK